MRWDLIDKFEVLKKGAYARARKSFTGGEDFFKEHFPGKPLVPQALFIEMIAQTGGVLFGLGIDFEKEVILAKVHDAKFIGQIAPPCAFCVEAQLDEEREEGAWISGVVRQDEKIVAQAKILLVTFDALAENSEKKIVFNDNFLNHFNIWEVAKMSETLR
jgi:3-hydroxyacyl-[acyl-carrier-protein] dehydratase